MYRNSLQEFIKCLKAYLKNEKLNKIENDSDYYAKRVAHDTFFESHRYARIELLN